jgi:glycerol dehydrogenase-like iron-containing ADH family enzyme
MVQLIMETAKGIDRVDYINTLIKFYEDVGLPYCAADFGPAGTDAERAARFEKMAEKALGNPKNHIHNMPFDMTTDLLVASMMKTSELKKNGKY